MKQYHFLFPARLLPIFDEIETNPPRITGFSICRLKYLISTILTHKQEDRRFSYSVLYMKYLERIVPEASQYMKFLRDKGIIEWKNYSVGRNSRLYRMTRYYDGRTVYRTITDHNLIRRIESARKHLLFMNSKKYPQLNHFVYMVELDSDAALKTIEKTYQEMSDNPERKVKAKAEDHRTYSLGEVQRIMSRHIYIKVNNTNFRYDTNFTRLPSELVKHLHIKRVHFNELDIVNSQPFFSSGLFNPTTEIQKVLNPSLLVFINNMKFSEKDDVKEYVSLVTNGQFYEFMMNAFRQSGLSFIDRQDFKERLFTVYFDKNSAALYSRAVRLFEELFPNVWILFKRIKRSEYNKLAILLQRMESHTILNHVATGIIEKFPDVPFLTKHDSILVPGNLEEERLVGIQSFFEGTLESVIGFRPKLKMK